MTIRRLSSKFCFILAFSLLISLSLCGCASILNPVGISNNSDTESDTSASDTGDAQVPLMITVKETPTTPAPASSDEGAAEDATEDISIEATQDISEDSDGSIHELKANANDDISNSEDEIMQNDSEKYNKLTPEEIDNAFFQEPISAELFEKMYGKSFKEDCTLPREELRYVHILHKTLSDETLEGELVCNKAIADNLIDIFRQLYDASYPIEKVRLIDEYDADDESSMADNNTSCFNYRLVSGTNKLSKHGAGMAVDINPLYNPYIHTINGQKLIEPANSSDYADRDGDYPYKITHDDLAYELFTSHGFTWGGDWKNSKDYQHFQK